MKKFLFLTISAGILLATGCSSETGIVSVRQVQPDEIAVFRSTDKKLEKAYEWARKTALSYSYTDADPVGSWYVASLPIREAFCMRDVSHQSTGAQILGLAEHNKNMLTHIADNIAESRDWCSYWEINRYGKPVPADYSNDREFWYNLTANPDVIQTCLGMYEWTGDSDYIHDPVFTGFYRHTVCDYVERWDLSPGRIMDRKPYMNQPENFDCDNKFHVCRGIPSYNENLPGLSLGVDLVAALYGGHKAYSRLLALNDTTITHCTATDTAASYRRMLETQWWNNCESRYHAGLMPDGTFVDSEGSLYILWFGATEDAGRIRHTLNEIASNDWDIQYSSYFPEIFYRYGYCKEGYDYMISLPAMSTSEYPEVAFSLVSACVCGTMGFNPSYSGRSVSTISRLENPGEESSISNIAVFDGYMSVRHSGHTLTEISNDTSVDLTWQASFLGDYTWIEAGSERIPVVRDRDVKGNTVSSAKIKLPANTSLRAKAVI